MKKHISIPVKVALLFLSLLLFPIQSLARDISFEWTAISEPLIGYKLYCQEGTSEVEPPIVLGKVTTHTLTGLASDKTYHFYLTAFNQAGESGSSAVVTVTPDSSLAPTIISMSIKQ